MILLPLEPFIKRQTDQGLDPFWPCMPSVCHTPCMPMCVHLYAIRLVGLLYANAVGHTPSCHTHALEPGGVEDAEPVLHDAEPVLHEYMHTGGGMHAEPVLHKLVKVRQRHCDFPHRYTSLRVLQNGAIRTCSTLLACCTSSNVLHLLQLMYACSYCTHCFLDLLPS